MLWKLEINFADEMFEAANTMSIGGEELCTDFISPSGPHSIELWPKGITYIWCTLLRCRDKHVDSGREAPRAVVLQRLLFRRTEIPSKSSVAVEEDCKINSSRYCYSFLKEPKPLSVSKKWTPVIRKIPSFNRFPDISSHKKRLVTYVLVVVTQNLKSNSLEKRNSTPTAQPWLYKSRPSCTR